MSGITSTTNNHAFAESEAAREQEQASTNRIREETRQAVNEYRQNHPPRTSASSSGTLAGNGAGPETAGEEPSDGRFAKAGLIGAASGSGAAAKAHMGASEGVEVPNKYGILSHELKGERKKMLKVCFRIQFGDKREDADSRSLRGYSSFWHYGCGLAYLFSGDQHITSKQISIASQSISYPSTRLPTPS